MAWKYNTEMQSTSQTTFKMMDCSFYEDNCESSASASATLQKVKNKAIIVKSLVDGGRLWIEHGKYNTTCQ